MGRHMSAIRLNNLDIAYGDTKVVHGVNLDIAEGESFALVGVFVATSDVTLPRVESRRLKTIRDLAVLSSAEFSSPGEAVARFCEILSSNRWGVPFAAIYLADSAGQLVVEHHYGVAVPTGPLPARVAAQSSHPVAEAVRRCAGATSTSPKSRW